MNTRERNALSRALLRVEDLERWNKRLAAELQAAEREREWALGQLEKIRGLTERVPFHPVYATETARSEARRRTWRESKQRRRAIEKAAA